MNDTPLPAPDHFAAPPPRRWAALLLIEREGRYAMIQRSYWSSIARWGIPGGSAAPDEHPRRAAARHLADKLALRATPGRLLATDYAPACPGDGDAAEGLNFVYLLRVSPGTDITPTADSGYSAVRWLTPDDVPALVIDHELTRFQQSLAALRAGTVAELLLGNPILHP